MSGPFRGFFKAEPWRTEAACRNEPRDIFFAEDRPGIAMAKAICKGCEVRFDCLRDGITEEFGVRGGMTPTERRGYARRMGRVA